MTGATIHTRRAEDCCTCDGPWPCPKAGYLTDEGMRLLRTRLDPLGGSVSMCPCCDRSQETAPTEAVSDAH